MKNVYFPYCKVVTAGISYEQKREKSKNIMDLTSAFRESTLGRTYDSYHNPRLENCEINYLTAEHREELRRESEIVVWDEYADPKFIPGVGTLRRIGIVTAQGYTYDTLVGIPERPECDIPVLGTTAWTTSLRGHNERIVRNLVRAGNYVIYVGAEGSYVADEPPVPMSPITLANSAAAGLNFSYHVVEELRKDGHDIHSILRFVIGESRGGMVAEGTDALAEDFAQDVLFSEEVAPCLPERIKSLADLYKLCEQIAKEPREMYRLAGTLTLARLRYYPHTIDIRGDCLRHQAIIGGALFSGEAGALARKHPGGTLKHLTVFENDFASKRAVWEGIYSDEPQTRITPLPGGHMTIADLETLRMVLARNKAAQLCVNGGLKLTPRNVFDRAHELLPRQYPITEELMNHVTRSA